MEDQKPMDSARGTDINKKLIKQLIVVSAVMLTGMTVYEVIKQVILPDITLWQSHLVTILFSTLCAACVSYLVLKRQIRLNNTLKEKNAESDRLREELGKTVESLEKSLAKVKTLSGLLPICSSCKKIRDDEGYWNKIEVYISNRANVDFSHGLCPDCAKKLYGDFMDETAED